MSKIIAIDFDCTIAETHYPYVDAIYEEAKIYIRKWRKDGHKIILWTCREGEPLQVALDACDVAGVVFDAVNESIPKKGHTGNPRKIFFDYVIDDKFPMPVSEQWQLVNQCLRR